MRQPVATRPGRKWMLTAVKGAHTLIWLGVEAGVVYLVYAGVTRRSDKGAAFAGLMVAGETAVFLGNGARCPLTDLAESLGAESGGVTDIYLPGWLARNLPLLHAPLITLILYLHGRNLLARRKQA
jgi:hypothetical protein